ncbi:MAG: AMP-binding protein [Solirubrobacterales bacterium]
MLREAQSAARKIAALGAAPGEPVALVLPPGEEFAVAFHGCLLLGCPAVPIDPARPARPPARRSAGRPTGPGAAALRIPLSRAPFRPDGRRRRGSARLRSAPAES